MLRVIEYFAVIQGHSRSFEMVLKLGYGFLFAFHSNYCSHLYHFRDKAKRWSQIAIFLYPLQGPLAFDVPVRVVPVRISQYRLVEHAEWCGYLTVKKN